MKPHIIPIAAGLSLTVSLLSSCALFTPTEAPEISRSSLIIPSTSDVSDSGVVTPDPLDPQDPSSSGGGTSSGLSADRHQRFLELEQEFSYDSSGKLCVSAEELAFADKTLFVGDSICRGFSAYNAVKARSVCAAGSIGVLNFSEKDFFYLGSNRSYADVLKEAKPERVLLWLGINDVNTSSLTEFCGGYRNIIDLTLENTSSEIYVAAIAPVNSDFADNSRIDEFNLAMKNYVSENFDQRVRYIDFAYLMKNKDNMLSKGLDNGDGVHLAAEAYYAAMLEICHQLEII